MTIRSVTFATSFASSVRILSGIRDRASQMLFMGFITLWLSETRANPSIHRSVGQNIKILDLALPYACNRMFVPTSNVGTETVGDSRETADYFLNHPQGLLAVGYLYRRIMFQSICREAHDFDAMTALASNQNTKIGWELVYEEGKRAAWCIGGYEPIETDMKEALGAVRDVDL